MDVALSGQWSGMPSFSLIILFLDKSVYCLNFTLIIYSIFCSFSFLDKMDVAIQWS